MNIVIICGMSDDKARDKITPISKLPEVDNIYLIRRNPLEMPKVIPYSPPSGLRRNLLVSELYRILALIYVCLTKKPDVIIGIYFVPHGIYTGVIGKVFRKRVIQVLIGTDRLKVQASPILFKILSMAEYVGVRGQTSKKDITALGIPPEKVFIPAGVNAIDFDRFRPIQTTRNYDLIYVGRLDRNKQVDKLIQAAATIYPQFPGLRVALIGDGPDRKHLEELTEQLNLKEGITFLGNIPNKEIPEYLNQARIFVMTSAFEGLPVAMIEALCCGLPLVVPNVGDITDIAKDGENALLIDPFTEENFVKVLTTLLSDPILYSQLEEGALETRAKLFDDFTSHKAQEIWSDVILPK